MLAPKNFDTSSMEKKNKRKLVVRRWLVFFLLVFFVLANSGAFASSLVNVLTNESLNLTNTGVVIDSQNNITIGSPEKIIEETRNSEKIPLIVQLDTKPLASHISILKTLGAKIKYKYQIINAVALSVDSDLVDKLSSLDFVKSVEPDAEVKIVLAQSALQIDANRVWLEYGVKGENVTVAVLDTGIDNEHPDLQNVVLEKDFTGEGTDDENGHGTHVASIIAGSGKSSGGLYKGIAPKARLMDIKVLNKDGSGRLSDVIAGIEYAVMHGADVISMSLGAAVPCDGLDAASLAADAAVERGVVVVVAAGNLGPSQGTITSPGCAKKVITVGAVDKMDNIAPFSSRGPTLDGRVKPDIVAPGVLITAAKAGGGYTTMSGTSMATPMVSGVVALILSKNPDLTPEQVKSVLKETAKDLGEDRNTQGAGRVDAYLAFIKASGLEPLVQGSEQVQESNENETKIESKEEAKKKAQQSSVIDEPEDVYEDSRNGQEYYVVKGSKNKDNRTIIVEVWINKNTGNIDFVEEINWFEAFIRTWIGILMSLINKLIFWR